MRRLLAAVVVLSALAAPAAARAVEPPTLGATLGATRSEVIIDSSANVPFLVELTAPEGWQLAETSFTVAPGGHHVVPVVQAGEDGQVIARIVAIEVPTGTDRSALVLALGLPKPSPAFPILPMLAVLGAVLLGLTAWRFRRHA